jgi:photosystem I P700 chlorophyll a apoprotein A2
MTLKVMMMLLKKLYIKRFSLLILVTLQLFFFGQQVIYSIAWQGNFEQWILNPLKVKPIMVFGIHFGETALKAFTRGGVIYPVNTSGVYQWWYTIGMRTRFICCFGFLMCF